MFRSFFLLVCWTCIFYSVSSSDSYRLPTSITPSYYKIEIFSFLGEPNNFDFAGKVWIKVNCHEATQNITLHSVNLTIINNKVTVKDISSAGGKGVKVVKVEPSTDDFLVIHLGEQLKKGDKYEIHIPFKGVTLPTLRGFYRSSYTDETSKEKKWIGVTQFEAIYARKAFPCFDEPNMKAIFEITIGRKEIYTSISNMPLLSTAPIKEKPGWFWDRYAPSVPMSTYLVAWVVSDFGFVTSPRTHSNVTFRVWARKNALDQVDFAKEVGPKFLSFYDEFFDIKYPLPKQDMVAIPDFSAGAMENWGLSTYRETSLLYDKKVSSTASKLRVASVIAHELAHQWFGNLVTMKWWSDLWLNEGFATFMATYAVSHIFPGWNVMDGDTVRYMLLLFNIDCLKSSHEVSPMLKNPSEIDEIFDTISYKKGANLLRMMLLFLGDDVFQQAVSKYLKQHQYNNAEQDDLWKVLTQEANEKKRLPDNLNIKTIMDTWTLQTGYPLVTITRNYEKNTAELTQQRFLKDEIQPKDDKNCWWIPLSYTNAKELDFNTTKPKAWMPCPKKSITIENLPDKDTFVIFNNKLQGLYKINYDLKNWQLISDALNSPNHKNIALMNKVQLIDDAFDLGWTGRLSYDVVFKLVKYLRLEEEHLPWSAVITKLDALQDQLRKTSIYGKFGQFMRNLVGPEYKKMGGFVVNQEKNRENPDYIKHQVSIASRACRYDLPECVADAHELFRKFRENPTDKSIIPKDFRNSIYCTVIRTSGEEEWQFLWTQYLSSNVASEKGDILVDLACTRELWILQRYLEWSIDEQSGIRKQDSAFVFSYVVDNDVGYYIAKNFVYNNVEKIYNHFAENPKKLSTYISTLAAQTTTEGEYDDLQSFLKDNKKYLKKVTRAVDQSLEKARLNVQWQKRHLNNMDDLLRSVNEETKSGN